MANNYTLLRYDLKAFTQTVVALLENKDLTSYPVNFCFTLCNNLSK